jgi:hypothetical protein
MFAAVTANKGDLMYTCVVCVLENVDRCVDTVSSFSL